MYCSEEIENLSSFVYIGRIVSPDGISKKFPAIYILTVFGSVPNIDPGIGMSGERLAVKICR